MRNFPFSLSSHIFTQRWQQYTVPPNREKNASQRIKAVFFSFDQRAQTQSQCVERTNRRETQEDEKNKAQ